MESRYGTSPIEVTEAMVDEALEATDGNITAAAKRLGLQRTQLNRELITAVHT